MTGSCVIQCNMKAFGMQNLRHNLHFQSPTALLQGTTRKGSRIGYTAAHRIQCNSRPTPSALRSNPSTCHTLHSTGCSWLFPLQQTNTQRRQKPASSLGSGRGRPHAGGTTTISGHCNTRHVHYLAAAAQRRSYDQTTFIKMQ
jgi:hypothetical protein